MERIEVFESNNCVELFENCVPSIAAADVIAGGEDVAGVDADAHGDLLMEPLHEVGQVLKSMADRRALPCGSMLTRNVSNVFH